MSQIMRQFFLCMCYYETIMKNTNLLSEKKHLKLILQSKRANIFYLEYCKVVQNGGRVEYLTQEKDKQGYYNIPIANTTVVLLGSGTSITQAAVRMLSAAGVMVGFCGGGGTPLFAGNEVDFISPQSEYRPTEYVQKWVSFWYKPGKRLEVAKYFQRVRLDNIKSIWSNNESYEEAGIYTDDSNFEAIVNGMSSGIENAKSVDELLQSEARITKLIYKFVAKSVNYGDFTRDEKRKDIANIFLNHGNYLAYGLAATALWTLGIPHSFAVMHGKSRRGALVFDVADLFKDAIVLPNAFICAQNGDDDRTFRDKLMNMMIDKKYQILNGMIETLKDVCDKFGEDII